MHIDNLHKNDWIVVIGHIPPEMTYEQHNNYFPPDLTGTPFKVLGISSPFVCCISPDEPEDIFTINTQVWKISKCPKGYETPWVEKAKKQNPKLDNNLKTQKEEKVSHLCPICREGKFIWVSNTKKFTCKNCKAIVVRNGKAPSELSVSHQP